MSEASCATFQVFFRELRRRKVPAEELTRGTGIPLEVAQNKAARIGWRDFLLVLRNIERLWSEEELVRLGGAYLREPLMRPVGVIARLLFSAKDAYSWAYSATGPGSQAFSCLESVIEHLGEQHVRITLTLQAAFEYHRAFFVITKGAVIDFPRVVGLPSAQVDMHDLPNGAVYDVHYPKGGGVLGWLLRAITWPFTARAAARELKQAYEVLQARVLELESTRAQLARKATQLQVARSISDVIHRELELQPTLHVLTRALVGEGNLAAARAVINSDIDGNAIRRTSMHGLPNDAPTINVPLTIHGRDVGFIELWPREDADREELLELLEYVTPPVMATVGDALTFNAVVDYRTNLEEKVEMRTAELREALDNLQQAKSVRDRIFANINHEIRTPLSLIVMASSDIRRRSQARLDESSRQRLADIDGSVNRLLLLVDGLLLLAAGQEGKLRMRLTRENVAQLLTDVAASWRPLAERHGLKLDYRGPDQCGADIDHAAVQRVVTNLVSNAVKFTPRGGSIRLELREIGDLLEITVRDTGIGIGPQLRQRIFDRFEQGPGTVNSQMQGSGIGLSIVKELVEAHGGEIWVEDNRGGGSCFVVHLPRFAVSKEDDTVREGAFVPAPVGLVGDSVASGLSDGDVITTPTSDARSVLVAEDDERLLDLIAHNLAADYRVIVAGDGLNALRLAEQHRPDLLVTDVSMPGMDGFELAQRFRELPGNRLAPVIILTAFGDLDSRLKGFDAGASDYIRKPFEPEELLARVRTQLELRRAALRLHEQEKLASLGVLTASLAHEFRNPANALVNALDPLVESLPAELMAEGSPTRLLLDAVASGAERIGELSRHLLGLVGPGVIEGTPTRFGDILETALLICRKNGLVTSVRIEIEDDVTVWCARPLVVQVLVNLIENAGYNAGPQGVIEVTVHGQDDQIVFEISDSGPDVPRGLEDRIFEPLFTTKPPGEGTGFGLTISRIIVHRHGGDLTVVTGGSRGSVFRLSLPLKRLGTDRGVRLAEAVVL